MAEQTMTNTMRDELEGLTRDMTAIVDGAKAAGRNDLTAEEVTNLQAKRTKATEIRDKISIVTDLDDLKVFLGDLSKPDGDPGTRSGKSLHGVESKTIGEQFAESKGYKAFLERYASSGRIPDRTQISFDPVDVKGLLKAMMTKALVTTTGGSPNPYAALLQPDRVPVTVDLVGTSDRVLKSLVRRIPTSTDVVEYVKITAKGTNAAAVHAEPTSTGSAAKAESTFWTYDVVQTSIDTIAHWIPVTRKAVSDIPQMQALLDAFLFDGLDEKLEATILAEIAGAGIYTVDASAGDVTDLDVILQMIAKVRTLGKRNPSAIIMSPDDWYSAGFALAKDTTGRYMLTDPMRTADDGLPLWGRRLLITDQATAGQPIVGDFSWCWLYDREAATLSVSDSHSDFFIKNLLAVLAELRATPVTVDPGAFCTVAA